MSGKVRTTWISDDIGTCPEKKVWNSVSGKYRTSLHLFTIRIKINFLFVPTMIISWSAFLFCVSTLLNMTVWTLLMHALIHWPLPLVSHCNSRMTPSCIRPFTKAMAAPRESNNMLICLCLPVHGSFRSGSPINQVAWVWCSTCATGFAYRA